MACVFERLIYLDQHSLINPQQSGFRSLQLTVVALLDLTIDWCVDIDKRCVNGMIVCDQKKAFETVNHDILIFKLEYFGFDCTAVTFFHLYLSSHKQECSINGTTSDPLDISCGVPQGTISMICLTVFSLALQGSMQMTQA